MPCRYCLYFDGVDDRVLVPASASLDSIVDLTVMAWVKEVARKAFTKIASRRTGNSFWFLGVDSGTPYGGIGDGTSYTTIRMDTTMPLNEWHCLAFVFSDASDKGIIYYDGAPAKEGSIPQSIGPLTGVALSIGADYQGTMYFFNGYIAQVLVYNRALSRDEILWNYNHPDNPIRDGLVLWLHSCPAPPDLEPCPYIQGNKWIDLSGNGNHGTIYGAQPRLVPSPW